MILQLTVFFFGGFVAVMFTLVCVASAVFAETAFPKVLALVLASLGALATLRCGLRVWMLLRSDDTAASAMDPRLRD